MRTAATLLLVTGTLPAAGCSLLINAELDDKTTTSAGGGAAGGHGGAEMTSVASTSAGMMMPATAAVTAAQSVSASSGAGCGADCKLDHAKSECVNGVCVVKGCDSHFDDCDQKPENGCETHLDTDAQHCGSCAQTCAPPKNHCMDSKCK